MLFHTHTLLQSVQFHSRKAELTCAPKRLCEDMSNIPAPRAQDIRVAVCRQVVPYAEQTVCAVRVLNIQ